MWIFPTDDRDCKDCSLYIDWMKESRRREWLQEEQAQEDIVVRLKVNLQNPVLLEDLHKTGLCVRLGATQAVWVRLIWSWTTPHLNTYKVKICDLADLPKYNYLSWVI